MHNVHRMIYSSRINISV